MAKYYGAIGFAIPKETSLGVWEEIITEVKFSGDILRNVRRWNAGEKINDDLTVNEQISIVANDFAFSSIGAIKYAVLHGARWKVTTATIQYPRIVLDIGGLYNGPGPKEDYDDQK